MKHIVTMLILIFILLSGCDKRQEVKVVSQITVTQERADGGRIYTDPYKMQRVLNKLRQLGQQYRPEADPAEVTAPLVCITLRFSDGSSRYYRLKADRYIQTDQQAWQQTDPSRLQKLYFLIKALPGDAPWELDERLYSE